MDNNFSNIKERVLQIAKYYGISYETFFQDIGMTYGNFKGNAKKTPLNSDAIVKILSKHPEISADWLILDKGEMLKSQLNERTDADSNLNSEVEPLNNEEMSLDILRDMASVIRSQSAQIDKLISEVEKSGARADRMLDIIEARDSKSHAQKRGA